MLLDELQLKRREIESLAMRYGASRVRVFGSVARREERDDSDVDVLVSLPVGYDLFAQRLPLEEALTRLCNRKVDLVPEHELNRHIRPYVLAEAVEL